MLSSAARWTASSKITGRRHLELISGDPQSPTGNPHRKGAHSRARKQTSDQVRTGRAQRSPRHPGSTQLTKFGRASRLIHPAPQRRGSGRRRTRRHIPFPCRPWHRSSGPLHSAFPGSPLPDGERSGPLFLPCFPSFLALRAETRAQRPALVTCRPDTYRPAVAITAGFQLPNTTGAGRAGAGGSGVTVDIHRCSPHLSGALISPYP